MTGVEVGTPLVGVLGAAPSETECLRPSIDELVAIDDDDGSNAAALVDGGLMTPCAAVFGDDCGCASSERFL